MKPNDTFNRRSFLRGSAVAGIGLGASAGLGGLFLGSSTSAMAAAEFEVTYSAKQWKKILSKGQYSILRKESTERPFTSPLLKEHREGNFHCAGCDLAVYPSSTKYDSKTGWPSFWDALPDAVRTKDDRKLLSKRTEVHCRRCGGHFGHIFGDGPKPTGKRHCLNGLALTFKAA